MNKTINIIKMAETLSVKKNRSYNPRSYNPLRTNIPIKGAIRASLRLLVLIVMSYLWVGAMLVPTPLHGQGGKIKIIQVGCLDLQEVFNIVRKDTLLQLLLEKGTSKDLGEARKLDKKLAELQTLLEIERAKANTTKTRDLENEIAYLKKQLEFLLAETSGGGVASNDLNATLSPAILKEIYRIVRQVSQNEGYSLILEKGVAVIYVEEALDITSLVVKELMRAKGKSY